MNDTHDSATDDRDRRSESAVKTKWTPRVEGEEGDPTAFDYVFGGALTAIVIVAILWAVGVVTF